LTKFNEVDQWHMYLPYHQVVASYSLAPSSSSLCLVCALPPGLGTSQVTASAVDTLKDTKFGKRSGYSTSDSSYNSDIPSQRQCLACTLGTGSLFGHHLINLAQEYHDGLVSTPWTDYLHSTMVLLNHEVCMDDSDH
jgi:hypothetical protein